MSLRAAFMGSPDFAVPSLHEVARTCALQAVVCQPDRPAGRGRKLRPPAIKVAAGELGVPIIQPTKMKDGTLATALRQYELDVIVVVAFGRILPPAILAIPRHGCINVHASILPRWRGAAPIQRAVLAGDRETGVAIMRMEEGLDTGPVYAIERTPIGPEETSGELFERLAPFGARLLGTVLASLPEVVLRPQDDAQATHAAMLRKEEGRVDFTRPVRDVVDHIRGMDPWPSAYTQRNGAPLKLFGAKAVEDPDSGSAPTSQPAVPGTVMGVDPHGLRVACLDGSISIAELGPAGKRRMPASAYAAGNPFAPDERLG